eukprot:1505353-Rhodomonas_salina.1
MANHIHVRARGTFKGAPERDKQHTRVRRDFVLATLPRPSSRSTGGPILAVHHHAVLIELLIIAAPLCPFLCRHVPPQLADLAHVVRLFVVWVALAQLGRHTLDEHLIRRRLGRSLRSEEGG